MNKAKSLIISFVEERLQGNLNELVYFDFAQLRGDKKIWRLQWRLKQSTIVSEKVLSLQCKIK